LAPAAHLPPLFLTASLALEKEHSADIVTRITALRSPPVLSASAPVYLFCCHAAGTMMGGSCKSSTIDFLDVRASSISTSPRTAYEERNTVFPAQPWRALLASAAAEKHILVAVWTRAVCLVRLKHEQ